MSEPLDVGILNALMTQLTTPAISGSPAIAYAEVSFVGGDANTAYLHAHSPMRAPPEHFGLDSANIAIHTGIFQVDAVAPDQKGEAAALRLAALVAARFVIGTKLPIETRNLSIIANPAIGQLVKDAPWIRIPVSITYHIVA